MQKKLLTLLACAGLAIVLPGCDWKSWTTSSCGSCGHHGHAHDHGNDTSAPCISLEGKSVFSRNDLENKFNDLCQINPGIQQAVAGLAPEQRQGFYDQLAEAVLAELLVARYMKEEGLTESEDYKRAARQAHEAVETQLMNNMFQTHLYKQIEKEITDEVAEKYYTENRDRLPIFKRPPFIENLGGVSTLAIEGLKQSDAQIVASRAEKQDFNRLAQEAQRKVKDLGLVTARSTEVDENIRSKVLGYSSAPQVDVVKLANGKYAVVKATAITKDTFKPYNSPEVKDAVKGLLIRNELGKAVTKTIEDLKQKYGAIIHRDAPQAQPMMSESAVEEESAPKITVA